MTEFRPRRPLLAQMRKFGLQFDQKLTQALKVAASRPDLKPEDVGFPDSYLTVALYRLNSILTRLTSLDENRFNIFHDYKKAPPCSPEEVQPGERLCSVLSEAASLAAPGLVIGAGHFLRAIAAVTRIHGEGEAWGFEDQVMHSTFSIETFMWGMGYHAWTPLAAAPKVQNLFAAIENTDPIDDIQFILAMEGRRIVLRPTSVLNHYRIESQDGTPLTGTTVLANLKYQCDLIFPAELMELEDLINHPLAKENDFQRFFETHQKFFSGQWNYQRVFPHVFLTRAENGPLIPDFLLVDDVAQRTTIVDLKLPNARIIRRQKNRDRPAASLIEARAQLLEYRDWFEEKGNRELLKKQMGLEIYRPHLGVVIGSSTAFHGAFDRQKLVSMIPDIQLTTYDDIVQSASRRLTLVNSASR